MVLERVNSPQDLKSLTETELETLAAELRTEIIRICSRGGLHLASSLGTVELTVALHRVFDSPTDRILWDVGHQAYGHKILTGRKARMDTLKREGGLSGFTKITESEHDAITVGHASTSLANALGMCLARDAQGEHYHVVPVIGDGALTGGMALAALNIIGDRHPRMTIILNDNEMSISPNVGAMNATFRTLQVQPWFQSAEEGGKRLVRRFSRPLEALLTRAKDATRTFFDPHSRNPFAAMNIRYVGPVDGHNVRLLTYLLEHIKQLDGPTILHVVTKKGKGLSVAEGDPTYWHSPAKFDPLDPENAGTGSYSWSNAFGDAAAELADEDRRVFVITPAMKEGSGLVDYATRHPDRFIDVGIAEEVAVTTGAGLALRGMKPVVAVYSTFLQRAFDQVIHDVSIEKLNVVFAIDRAGVVGPDGPTHNGVFDLSYLRLVPNMTVAAPRNALELRAMLKGALEQGGPVGIRYPRGAVARVAPGTWPNLEWGTWERLRPGSQVCVLAVGRTVEYALAAAETVEDVGVVNARFVKPLDEAMLLEVARTAKAIVTVEDNTVRGGFGAAVLEFLAERDLKVPVRVLGLPDRFLEHAEIASLHAQAGIDADGIRRVLRELGTRPAMLAVGDD
ncbi:MAG TPA: 1-deoxy-D-xylulose-5-phosphate synthase [Deinococcales bacterium]|nr:1-deoxy-D-xylulose-5-phosphate synthase [Deinococcales bacterium]